MAEELELPDELWGFGNWLLWVLATRATALVDRAYEEGPARSTREYGKVDGHPVPTPSLVAWLLLSAESGIPLPDLRTQRSPQLRKRQDVLRTTVNSAINGQPHLFKAGWLDDLAEMCELGDTELRFLRHNLDVGSAVEPAALRTAIDHTFQARQPPRNRATTELPAGQVVVGEIPREPAEFVVRETLRRLAKAAGRGQVAVVCAVTGLRGVGKTQLAAAYARNRVSRGWGLVGWVNAETPSTLVAGLAQVAARLGIADPKGDSIESARRLREHLQTRADDALLVFDNAASPAELRPFLPATGSTQVVVTSTDQDFAELGEVVDVSVFTRSESLRFLRARTGLTDDDGAFAVADALADLPLALAQGAATIRRQHLTYTSYLERLSRVPVEELLGAIPGGDYPYSSAAALLLSVQATEAGDATGQTSRLLRVVAVLSPNGVRRDLLAGLAASQDPGQSEDDVDTAVEHCVAGSLLTWSVTGDAVIMHRLLGRVLRERDQANGQWGDTVIAALDLLETRLFPEKQAWGRREEGAHLIAQIEALWEAAGRAASSNPDLLLRQLRARSWGVRQLLAAADFSRVIDTGARVLADCERLLGTEHPDTLSSGNNLAEIHWSAGHLEQAIKLHKQTLAGRERVLGADHPDTLTSRNNLASSYWSASRLDQAIQLHEQTLAGRERVLGTDHPDTLASRSDLATAYWSVGRRDQAASLFRQILADRERILGVDHPDTLFSRNNLAVACWNAGRRDEAIRLHEQTLADRERVLGVDHPDTLFSRNNLARCYQAADRLDESIPLHEQTLANCERVLGTDHPTTLQSRHILAIAYAAAGRLDAAIPLHEQTLADRERILGTDHPNTLTSRDHLALAYAVAGRLDEAISQHEQTLADRERVLGTDHPDTLTSRDHLAEAYVGAGQLDQAIHLHEHTLADRERILGTDHPDTLTSRDHLNRAKTAARS